MTATLRPFTGVGLQKEIPNTMDFQEANSKGKFSAHHLRNKQNNTKPKSPPRPRCSGSLITAGAPIKNDNQISNPTLQVGHLHKSINNKSRREP